jgi:hypothetical protein
MVTSMRWVVVLALSLFPTLVYAQHRPGTGPRAIEPNPEQYMMSCDPTGVYGMSGFNAGLCKTVTESGVHVAAPNVLFRFGEQLKIRNDASGTVLVCAHQTTTATVAMGSAGTGGSHTSAAGFSAGYCSFDSASSSAGRCRCSVVGPSEGDFIKISKAWWQAPLRTPTARTGRCTSVGAGSKASIGGGCLSNAECGTGVCDLTTPPDGVYLSVCAVSAASVVQLQLCGQ